MRTLAAANAMPPSAFEMEFGDVAEHSPWVARCAAAARPFVSRAAMVEAFINAVKAAPQETQLALIRAHPDLATKAKLTNDTLREQAGAGLDALTQEEFDRFTRLNGLYKSKFGFPFIIAVRSVTKGRILENFDERLKNTAETEFTAAMDQISRILRFRIEDRVSP